MLINDNDVTAVIGVAFSLLEISPNLRGEVIDHLKACDRGEYDEEEPIDKLIKFSKSIFYGTENLGEGIHMITAGIKKAIGEPAQDNEEVLE